jgi:hypothetical protein
LPPRCCERSDARRGIGVTALEVSRQLTAQRNAYANGVLDQSPLCGRNRVDPSKGFDDLGHLVFSKVEDRAEWLGNAARVAESVEIAWPNSSGQSLFFIVATQAAADPSLCFGAMAAMG